MDAFPTLAPLAPPAFPLKRTHVMRNRARTRTRARPDIRTSRLRNAAGAIASSPRQPKQTNFHVEAASMKRALPRKRAFIGSTCTAARKIKLRRRARARDASAQHEYIVCPLANGARARDSREGEEVTGSSGLGGDLSPRLSRTIADILARPKRKWRRPGRRTNDRRGAESRREIPGERGFAVPRGTSPRRGVPRPRMEIPRETPQKCNGRREKERGERRAPTARMSGSDEGKASI